MYLKSTVCYSYEMSEIAEGSIGYGSFADLVNLKICEILLIKDLTFFATYYTFATTHPRMSLHPY